MTFSDIVRAWSGFVFGLLIAAAIMGLAECSGPSDAELDAAEVALWESRGVEIGRW